LTEPHFLEPVGEGPRHCAVGEVIEYSGAPSLHMEPLDQAARDRLAEEEARRGKRGRHPHGEPAWTGRR
jgi:hypothetical protein